MTETTTSVDRTGDRDDERVAPVAEPVTETTTSVPEPVTETTSATLAPVTETTTSVAEPVTETTSATLAPVAETTTSRDGTGDRDDERDPGTGGRDRRTCDDRRR